MLAQNVSVSDLCKSQLSRSVHGEIINCPSHWNVFWTQYWSVFLMKPKKLQTVSFEWEPCQVLKFVFVAS